MQNDSTSTTCTCATDTHCQRPLSIEGLPVISIFFRSLSSRGDSVDGYTIPGMIQGCFTIESLLLSTLQCFFSDSDCLGNLINALNKTYFSAQIETPWFNVHPLIYHEASNQSTPRKSLSLIIKEMMIEQWNQSISYDRYYKACAPSYCTYSITLHGKSFMEILIKLISLIGGLTAVLRLITPPLGQFVLAFLQPKVQKQQRGN